VSRPVTVAITGGIGAGKTEALKAFARHGAAVASCDEIVHRLLAGDPDVLEAVRGRWGDDVLAGDGRIDRSRVAMRVFGDRDELDWLEALLHPRVVEEYETWKAEQTGPLTVVEIPLLYETGADKRFDRVVVITAPPEVRAARRSPADDREARLLPDEEKMRRADYAFVNAGSREELDRFVAQVVKELTRSGGRRRSSRGSSSSPARSSTCSGPNPAGGRGSGIR
jgi:dephospho-CoA kinase